jgi:hypothetical protein
MEIRPVGAELLHADGRTDRRTEGQMDMTKLIVAFRNFVKAQYLKPQRRWRVNDVWYVRYVIVGWSKHTVYKELCNRGYLFQGIAYVSVSAEKPGKAAS